MKKLLITLVILLLPSISHAALVPVNVLRDTVGRYITPIASTTDGLRVPGLATSTTGCLGVAADGWISASGSACGIGGFAYPFPNNATTTPLTFASSTNAGRFLSGTFLATSTTASIFPYASTTALNVFGSTYLTALSQGQLNVGNGGLLYPGASTTFSGALTYSAGNVTCNVATASVAGCISAASFSKHDSATTTFSSPLVYTGGTNAVTCPTCLTTMAWAYPFTPVAGGNSTTSLMYFYNGIYANNTSSSTIRYASTTALTVATAADIPRLSNLTSNGFVKTGSSNGTLSIDTNTYLTSLAGAASSTLLADINTFSGVWNGFLKMHSIGTTTPRGAQEVIASSTGSQLLLSSNDLNYNANFRMAGGILYFASSSPATPDATSTIAAMEINMNTGTLPNIQMSTTTSASSTILMGKMQWDGYNAVGVRVCKFVNSSNVEVIQTGACNQ